MIWTALKIVLFLAAVAGLTLGVDSLVDQDAGLRIAFANTEFTLGPIQMALAALLLLGGLWLLLKLSGLLVATLRFINGDDTAISRYFEQSRKRKGLEALTEGFLALATNDGDKALTKARKAEKFLDNQTLTNLLMAQAAQSKGNTQLAEDYYRRLLEEDRSRFVGVQGLMRQQIDAGHRDKARKLAEKALSMRPDHSGTQDTLLSLQNQTGDWGGARRTLLETSRSGRMPRDVFRRRDAVLTLQQAEAEGANVAMAQDLVIESNKLSPELVPAAVRAAKALTERGKKGPATKVIKRAWKAQQHPELAAAFAAIVPNEAPAQRVRRFEGLLSLIDCDEARQTRAELLIAAEDFPAARRAIGDLHETNPTQRVMTIMAAIERGEGSSDQVVRGWLARALTAPHGPQWICDNCQHAHAQWHVLCENCGAFDTLSWKTAPESTGPSATGTEMLPLIVGALPAPDSADDASDEDIVIDVSAPEPAPEDEDAPSETGTSATATDDPQATDDVASADANDGPEDAEVIDLAQTRRAGL